MPEVRRRLPFGAEPVAGGGVHFRVWAPDRARVEVVLEGGGAHALAPAGDGFFEGHVEAARAGTRYRLRLDDGALLPDPASRFQPEGPHGPSEVIDPSRFRWTDRGWRGIRWDDPLVVYELHVGTFTREGTYEALARELPYLAGLGVTVIELLPVAEFDGRFGWGYDGVDLFAPTRLYGRPDDLRALVDRAHGLGLAVILDVVYNHFGPSGNYLRRFADAFFTDRHVCDWGEAIDFDGPRSGPVRSFFASNAAHWIAEYRLDGLRLDATQSLNDASPRHVVAEVAAAARGAAGDRSIWLVAENEPQRVETITEHGVDALWNDDLHHSARVALTGRREAYYRDYAGTPQELVSAAKRGFLFQGQRYDWQGKRRGTPTRGVRPERFVAYLQNHDQVANAQRGERLHQLCRPGELRAATACLLLAPWTPMLFQGQECAASSPFLYFADHEPELAAAVRKGRGAFLTQFPTMALPESRARLDPPEARETFERCKLDPEDRVRNAPYVALHRDLLRLRREDVTIARRGEVELDGAVLGSRAFCLRWLTGGAGDRLLLVNLGAAIEAGSFAEPLLAPPTGHRWRVRWSSEDHAYGGRGTPEVETDGGWAVPADAAVLLAPEVP